MNINPVLVAHHFQDRVQVFFKEILFVGPLGKTSYYVYRVEFQIRGSPHIYSFNWIQNEPKLTPETEEEYTQFVEKLVSTKLPDPVSEPEPEFTHIQEHTESIKGRIVDSTMAYFFQQALNYPNLYIKV